MNPSQKNLKRTKKREKVMFVSERKRSVISIGVNYLGINPDKRNDETNPQ